MNEAKPWKVYVSCPLSDGDQMKNVRYAIMLGDLLMRMGYQVYVPHLTIFWHFLIPHTHAEWLAYDEPWQRDCEVLVRAGGDSKGCAQEESLAERINQPIVWGLPELVQKFPPPIGEEAGMEMLNTSFEKMDAIGIVA